MSKIAACLITKNSEATLEACLASVRPFLDEVCVYDTGSTDGTLELLERLDVEEQHEFCACGRDWTACANTGGCPERPAEPVIVPLAPIRVEQGEWRDDFAWAREQSFQMVSDDVEWFLWLDDDDEIQGGPWLRQFAATAHPQIDGFVHYYDYARDETGANVCQLWRERLVRRSTGWEWKGAVHEVLVRKDGQPPNFVMVPPEQVRYVHHRPPDRYPSDRNLQILLRDLERAHADGREPDARALAYLGTEHMARAEFAAAVPYLERYVTRPDAAWGDERAQVHHKLATCLRALGNPHAAVEAEMRSLRERDDWAETHVGLAQAFAALGQWDRAERWAKQALQLGMPQSMLILNPLEFTLLPLTIVADACANQGRGEEARAAIAEALAAFPDNTYVRERAQEIERALAENEIVGAVMLLRETLVRHDENLKAHHLLENVPYLISERPEVVKARADQREMVAHYLRPEEYARWYADEPKESTFGDEFVPEVGDYFPRAKRLLEGLREQEMALGRKPRLLDLGGNDMWVACYLWEQGGYETDGVELNRQSVEKGLARMDRFGVPSKLVHGDLHDAPKLLSRNGSGHAKYDAVCLFEVLEHVPDPDACLKVCEKMLRPGGRVYLSTPNGAYERGQLPAWSQVERKGHLRAITAHGLCDTVTERGTVEAFELQHEGRVTFLAYTPRKRKGHVVFYAGQQWEPWSPVSIDKGGIGGSETALVRVAIHMAHAGWKVTVYSSAEPGLVGGALFRPHTAWDPTEEADLLVASRRPDVFDNPLGAKATALWCHDHSYPGQMTEQRADKMTHAVVLSDWERDRYARLYPFLADKLRVIRNGISVTGLFDGANRYPKGDRGFHERRPVCVYSSSADRGLDVLLELWPRIRERVPAAELHVYYGFNVFDRVAMANPDLAAYKARVLALAEEAGGRDGGVFLRGRVGQRRLAAKMQQARVWTYPTAFLETSCIGAMEARAAGLALVTSELGALRETVGTHGQLLPWGLDEDEPCNRTERYAESFVERVSLLLTDDVYWTRWHERARRGVGSLDWSKRVPEWEALVPKAEAKPKRTRARAKAVA